MTDESLSNGTARMETYYSQPQQRLRYTTQSPSWAYSPTYVQTLEFQTYVPNNIATTSDPRPVSSQPSLPPPLPRPQGLSNGDPTHGSYPFHPTPSNSWWPGAFNIQDDTANAPSTAEEQGAQEKVEMNMRLGAYWIPGRSTYK